METLAAIIHYCEYQERCHSEVRNKLYELGCTTPEVERMIAELIGIDKINEERFARAFARGKFRMKQWGREKIKQHLKVKKISEYCIKKAMTEIDPAEYEKIMLKLLEKKQKELKSEKNHFIKNNKIYKYMMQKGYERDIIIDMLTDKKKTYKSNRGNKNLIIFA